METKTVVQLRIEQEDKIFRGINKEILKCAKKGDLHYYWDISGLSAIMVKSIVERLGKEGKYVNSKGTKFKIIRW